MTTTGYSPAVDDDQERDLRAAHDAVAAAERAEQAARDRRNRLVVEFARIGVGATEIARVLNADNPPWRPVHRVTAQKWITDTAGPVGGAGRPRGVHLDDDQAAQLREAHRALHEAGKAIDAAIDRRAELFVALYDDGVPVLEQAALLDLNRNTVQTPITARARGTGRPRRNRARA